MTSEQGITQLLVRWGNGDQSAFDELLPLVYDDLRRFAHSYLRQRSHNHTLQATALVHEAYLRLAGKRDTSWQNRAQFFGLAAKVMRGILVDYALAQKAAKRGGSQMMLSLSEADKVSRQSAIDLLTLDQALNRLAELNASYARIVELRYFGGLTTEETAEVMGTSISSVERGWKFSRAWLRAQLG